MRELNTPEFNTLDVYLSCVDSIDNEDLRARLNAIKGDIDTAANEYIDKAPIAELYLLQSFNGANDEVVTGSVTKEELKKVYTEHMVGQTKPARRIYDELRMGAPLNICPFCGFGQVGTLDHYLPKAKYPRLSVLPINLVPSCIDCNKGKKTGFASTANQQCIHPYFDHNKFIAEQWLFAKVIETTPVSIQYYVDPPNNWTSIDKARVEAHFSDFKLSSRYAIQAADELINLKGLLLYDFNINGKIGVQKELHKRSNVAFARYPNSWQTAMFQSLATNDWYCQDGFNAVSKVKHV